MDEQLEQSRLADLYGGYARDPRRRRAWASDNPGNVAMRAEVGERIAAVAADAIAGDRPILDAGCGTGHWLDWLARQGVAMGRLHGVDLLPQRIAAAARRLPEAQLHVADVRRLPFEDDTFGLVLLLTVLSSLSSREAMVAALSEARRVAGRDGVVVVWDVRRSPRRSTASVPRSVLEAGLGAHACLSSSTLLPPLARRLGRTAPFSYPALASIPPLRTHWFAWTRECA